MVTPRRITTVTVDVTGRPSPTVITAWLECVGGEAPTVDGSPVLPRLNTFCGDDQGRVTLELIPTESIRPSTARWILTWPESPRPLRLPAFGPGGPVTLGDLLLT